MRIVLLFSLLVAPMLTAAEPTARDAFWHNLRALCGQAFAGRMVEGTAASDAAFVGRPMVMHVRACGEVRIEISFQVGDNRSRTWIITRTADGLRLKHDHRHEDGTEDEVTQYGGDTRTEGSATRQDFDADQYTANLIPAAATNIWSMILEPGKSFAYGLRREPEDRRFRVEYDLSRPVPLPPAPWGARVSGRLREL